MGDALRWCWPQALSRAKTVKTHHHHKISQVFTNIDCTSVASQSYGFHHLAFLCPFTAYFGSSEATGQTDTKRGRLTCSHSLWLTLLFNPVKHSHAISQTFPGSVWKQITVFRNGKLQKPFTCERLLQVLLYWAFCLTNPLELIWCTSRSGHCGPLGPRVGWHLNYGGWVRNPAPPEGCLKHLETL